MLVEALEPIVPSDDEEMEIACILDVDEGVNDSRLIEGE